MAASFVQTKRLSDLQANMLWGGSQDVFCCCTWCCETQQCLRNWSWSVIGMRNWKLTTIPPTKVGEKCPFWSFVASCPLFPTPERPLFYFLVEERWWPAWFDPCSIWNGNSLRCHPEAPPSPLFTPPFVWLWLWKEAQQSVSSCAHCREGCGHGIPQAKSSPVHTQLVYFIFVEQFFPLNSFLVFFAERQTHWKSVLVLCICMNAHTCIQSLLFSFPLQESKISFL